MSRLISLRLPLQYSPLARRSPNRANLAFLQWSPLQEQRRCRSAASVDYYIESRGDIFRPHDGRNVKSNPTYGKERRDDSQREDT